MTIYTVKNPNSIYTIDKAKKENVLALIIFWCATIFLLWFCWYSFNEVGRDIGKWLEIRVTIIPFVLLFVFSVPFVTIMAIKKPKKFIGTLIKKEVTDEGVHLMCFEFKALKYKRIVCYTEEDNPFVVDKDYAVYIKECNEVVVSIEELNESSDRAKLSYLDKILNDPNFILYYGVISVISILVFIIIVAFVGIFLYPSYAPIYIIVILMLSFTVYRLLNVFKQRLK
ncbi:MAG: hypothetical protein IJL76_00865 [Bacilli bacterium]|nr:hypothetical protein [Bacilli bacterium]